MSGTWKIHSILRSKSIPALSTIQELPNNKEIDLISDVTSEKSSSESSEDFRSVPKLFGIR